MRRVALAFLVVAGALFVVADLMVDRGAAPVWGFVRAGAEAGLVGGLADWFAVTALFRHPLGIPIPHTALIPRRKKDLAQGLSTFVQEHFLTHQAVSSRVQAAQIPARVSRWAATDEGAATLDEQLCPVLKRGVAMLREDTVRPVLTDLVRARVRETEVSAVLGRVLEEVLAEKSHQGLVDAAVRGSQGWLETNRHVVVDAVVSRAPQWTPDWVDELVADRLHRELCRFVGEVARTPDHRVRAEIDAALAGLARDLRTDPDMQAKVERAKNNLMDRPEVNDAVADVVSAGRRIILEMLDDSGSLLRVQLRAFIVEAAVAVRDDPAVGAAVDRYLTDTVATLATRHSADISALISDTMEQWDGKDAALRVERQAGRDLQFIRINGTVVGALVGILLHALTHLW